MKLPAQYQAARRALAQALHIVEVKDIRDKAVAIEVYAYQAKDAQLAGDAVELRKRATRRIGELMEGQPKAKPPNPKRRVARKPDDPPTLADQGVDKNLADRARKAWRMPEKTFEAECATARLLAEAVAMGDKQASKIVRAKKQQEKKQRRAVRERELGSKQQALPERCYGVIVADPEWRFEPWSRETGMDRAADNHYPTSVTEVIAARDVPSIAADDCVLWLWATIPMLPHALTVMAAWGFDYVSHYAWGKDKIGTGYWSREKHELLLIGIRGKIVCPAQGEQFDSLIMAPRGEHSEKPECFLEMIERYFPTLPKIELNRRGPPRPGWDAWGYEAAAEAAE